MLLKTLGKKKTESEYVLSFLWVFWDYLLFALTVLVIMR